MIRLLDEVNRTWPTPAALGLLLVACSGTDSDRDADGDGTPDALDCAPDDADIHPGAVEVCDSVDQDCDGQIDEGAVDAGTWYVDADSDGYGAGTPATACTEPEGHVADGTDCDDTRADVHPGATEVYGDGADNDCVDDGTPHARPQRVRASLGVTLVPPEPPGECPLPLLDIDGDGEVDLLCTGRGGPVVRPGPFWPELPRPILLRDDLDDAYRAWVWPIRTRGGAALAVGSHGTPGFDPPLEGYNVPATLPLPEPHWTLATEPGESVSGVSVAGVGRAGVPGFVLQRYDPIPVPESVAEVVELPTSGDRSWDEQTRWRWAYPAGACGVILAVGDLDQDGVLDAICKGDNDLGLVGLGRPEPGDEPDVWWQFSRGATPIADAGDLTGDGIDDLLLNVVAPDDSGAIDAAGRWLVPGPREAEVAPFLVDTGLPSRGNMTAADLDDDGIDDLLVTPDPEGADTASIYVWLGPFSGPRAPEDADLIFTIDWALAQAPVCRAESHDLDGDGLLDWLVSCRENNGLLYVLPADHP